MIIANDYHVRFGSLAEILRCRGPPESGHSRVSLERPLIAKAGSCNAANASLLDHLVGPRQQAIRRIDAKYLGRLEVDDKLKFGGVLDRQIARLFALEYTVHIARGVPVQLNVVDAVERQSAVRDPVTEWIDGRKPMLIYQRNDPFVPD